MKDRKEKTAIKLLQGVIKMYEHRGFNIDMILGDNEFEPLRGPFPQLNTAAAGEHVPDIERCIRTIKERMQSAYNVTKYPYIPRLMLIYLAKNAVLWLNALPADDGVSQEASPRFIMTGRELTYEKHVRIELGQYAQTHEEHDNSMDSRTMGCICLGPTGNAQGGHWFMSLTSGAKVIRYQWTKMPIPTDAINRVYHIGQQQGMPSTITYSNRRGEEILDTIDDFDGMDEADDSTYVSSDGAGDNDTSLDADSSSESVNESDSNDNEDGDSDSDGDNDDSSYHPSDDDEAADDDDDSSYHPLDDDEAADNEPLDDDHSVVSELMDSKAPHPDNNGQTGVESIETTGVDDHTDKNHPIAPETLEDNDNDHADIADDDNGTSNKSWSQEIKDAVEEGRQRALDNNNTRPQRARKRADQYLSSDYTFAVLTNMATAQNASKIIPDETFYSAIAPHTLELKNFLTAQMTAKKGLKVFGQRGVNALMKELNQLLTRNVMHPVHARSLTREQKIGALKYLMFLKEKRSGEVKGRGCADGRKQRVYKTKEETHSPTVSNEAMFISAIFDAKERRDVAIVDIPGAFMQADIDEEIHIRLDGEQVDLIVRMDPSYAQFITYQGKKKVIYTKLDKALSGTMQGALLFWRRRTNFLVDEIGFEINPYDSCVANKTIKGEQFTICWHVDDLKLSHKCAEVVDDIIKKLQDEFGKESPFTVKRGKVFDDYLGMKMDFSQPGKVLFSMEDSISRVVDETPDELLKGPCSTPAANHLFHIDEKAELLSSDDAEKYHHLKAMILYLGKKTRPDIQTAISFLTTMVQQPTVDDWKKLRRCIRYLAVTSELPLTLEAHPDCIIKWWVDVSYAVHPNMRSHTGATMTLFSVRIQSRRNRS